MKLTEASMLKKIKQQELLIKKLKEQLARCKKKKKLKNDPPHLDNPEG